MSTHIDRATTNCLAVLLVLLGAFAAQSRAEFTFTSQSAVFDPSTGQVQFTVQFTQAPDFFTLDQFGRQAHSFQHFIVGNPNLPYPERYDSIVRGEEIHLTGTTIRIRDARPSVPDPAGGGWGAIRGSVPFSVNGNVLTFATPLPLVSDHSTDGHFAYRLESYEFGALRQFVESESIVVPDPAMGTLLMALVVFCGGGPRSRWHRASR